MRRSWTRNRFCACCPATAKTAKSGCPNGCGSESVRVWREDLLPASRLRGQELIQPRSGPGKHPGRRERLALPRGCPSAAGRSDKVCAQNPAGDPELELSSMYRHRRERVARAAIARRFARRPAQCTTTRRPALAARRRSGGGFSGRCGRIGDLRRIADPCGSEGPSRRAEAVLRPRLEAVQWLEAPARRCARATPAARRPP